MRKTEDGGMIGAGHICVSLISSGGESARTPMEKYSISNIQVLRRGGAFAETVDFRETRMCPSEGVIERVFQWLGVGA